MEIVRTSLFERSLKKLGASAADLERLETEIAFNPTVGDVIQGLSGARKARFSMAGRGKSGGGRAIYVLVVQAARPTCSWPTARKTRKICPLTSARCLQRLLRN
jgi:hypothetical protein